jgi:hypothetical protein
VSAIWLAAAEVNHFTPCSRQIPSASRRATVSESPTSEPPVLSVIHWPLVQKPRGVAAGQPRNGALDQRRVAGIQQRACRAVGHGERAGVDVGGRREQVGQGELVDPREPAVLLFIGGGHDAALGGGALGLAPDARGIDPVDPLAPGIPLRQPRLLQPVLLLHPVPRPARQRPQLAELRLDLLQHVGGERGAQVAAQRRIVGVLVAQLWRRLTEGHNQMNRSTSRPSTRRNACRGSRSGANEFT